ncbi:MAG: hypothetical protein SFU56_05400 [Capsulimonadales bacterium]|nr:hypothetical protein [Capsulimonadales bacterium]
MERNRFLKWSGIAMAIMLCTAVVWVAFRRSQPILETGKDTPNPLVVGDPEKAVRQTERLVAALKAVQWDYVKVPRELAKLPDSALAEDPVMREANTMSYRFVPSTDPNIPEVAVYTDIYVRRNIAHFAGDRTVCNPEGFYIVGFRDGRVVKVPIDKVRLGSNALGGRGIVFPDTKNYKENLPLAWKPSRG